MEYKLVEAENGAKLEQEVADLISKGWKPIGGVSVAVCHSTWENERKGYQESSTDWVYAQAMIYEAQ